MPVSAPIRRTIPVSNETNPSPVQLSAVARQDRAIKCISGQWNGAFLGELEEHLVRKVQVRDSAVVQHLRLEKVPKSKLVSGKPTAVEKLAETSQVMTFNERLYDN